MLRVSVTMYSFDAVAAIFMAWSFSTKIPTNSLLFRIILWPFGLNFIFAVLFFSSVLVYIVVIRDAIELSRICKVKIVCVSIGSQGILARREHVCRP